MIASVPVRMRLQQEGDELDKRIQKLNTFVSGPDFRKLEPLHQQLILAQRASMTTYLTILGIRLGAMGGPVNATSHRTLIVPN